MATKYPIIISANNLAETLALEHAALALCLLIYLGYTVVISRCRTCREHFDSPANVLAQSTSNVVPGTQPSAAHLKLKEETKSRVVTMAAMLTCAISLILRVIPLLYPASSLVDARNVILAGTNALIFTLSSAHPGRVRMIFLLDVLADTLLLMAIWLALARQAFALHIASRNGGHTLVLGHYWRIFSPMAGWTCVAVAVVAVPCTELLTFLLFDRYATSTMGFKNLASSALASSHQPIFIYNRVDNYDNVTSSQNQIGAYNHTGVMITTGLGWALSRIITCIWSAVYAAAGIIVALATRKRWIEMYNRRIQAIPISHLALYLKNNNRLFVHLFALPTVALLYASVAGTQASLAVLRDSSGYWQLIFTAISSAILPIMYLLLIYTLSANIYSSRTPLMLADSEIENTIYDTNRSQTLYSNPDHTHRPQSEVNHEIQQPYLSEIFIPPLLDNQQNITIASSPAIEHRSINTEQLARPLSIDNFINPMNMLVTRGEATPSLLEKNAKKRRVAERRLTGSIASFVDILPEVPRRLLYTSFKGIRMRSNDSIGNTHQRHVSESIQPTNRRRSLSLPALPVLPIRRTQQNRSVLSAFGTFRNRAACHRSTESIKTANHVTGTTPTDAATNNLESNSNVINRNSMMLSDNSSISFINSHLDTDQSNSNHTLPSILSSSPVSARRLPINFESLHLRNSTGSISSIPSPVNSQLIHTTRYGTTVDRHSMQSSMWAESTAITTEDHSARSQWPFISSVSAIVTAGTNLYQRASFERSPTSRSFVHLQSEQNTSLTVNDANLHNLEAGDHVIYNESYSQDDVGANLLPRVANDSFEHTINNNDRLNGIENQELEPFSFVVPPPPRRRRRQFHPNALSSRSFPSHRHTNSTRIVAKSCALNENLRTRIRQASLPSLPRVATYTNQLAVTQNSHIEPEFITRIASNCAQQHTSRSQSNRSILQQCQLHLPLVALPHSPIRPSFTSQSNHDRVDVDSQYSTSLSRRRIDLGSYGGLDLGSFGNGGVTECSDEDDIITENILV